MNGLGIPPLELFKRINFTLKPWIPRLWQIHYFRNDYNWKAGHISSLDLQWKARRMAPATWLALATKLSQWPEYPTAVHRTPRSLKLTTLFIVVRWMLYSCIGCWRPPCNVIVLSTDNGMHIVFFRPVRNYVYLGLYIIFRQFR